MNDVELLDDIDDNGTGLTRWEIDRVEEWLLMLDRGGTLSDGQRRKAEQIQQDRCP